MSAPMRTDPPPQWLEDLLAAAYAFADEACDMIGMGPTMYGWLCALMSGAEHELEFYGGDA